MKQTIAAAAFVGLAACIPAQAADDMTAQAKAEYETAKAQCKSVPERKREDCLSEAKARYQAHLKQAPAEHRDNTARGERGREAAAAGSRAN
jgi:hypothetical protein